MRRLRPAERRRRALAARRRNRWETEPCPPAEHGMIERAEYRMFIHDNIEPIWRALMHHYGFEFTNALHDACMDPQVAHLTLEDIRIGRQRLYDRPYDEMPAVGAHGYWKSNES